VARSLGSLAFDVKLFSPLSPRLDDEQSEHLRSKFDAKGRRHLGRDFGQRNFRSIVSIVGMS
jgi:hypothetical protein